MSAALASPHCLASGSNEPPSASVADVSTTVLRPNSLFASSPPTCSGATRRVGGLALIIAGPVHPHHMCPVRDGGVEGAEYPLGGVAHLADRR